MKKKTHKILGITATLGITLAIGGVLAVANQPQQYEGAHAYVIDEEEETLYLSYTDLQYNTYSYLAESVNELITLEQATEVLQNTEITYNGKTYFYSNYLYDYDGEYVTIAWIYNSDLNNTIEYHAENGIFRITENGNEVNWEYGIEITNAEWVINHLQAPADTSDIVPTITTGLGLIGDLAEQFLAGFTGIFWNETNQRLSNVGIFSMVMLGIGITFSVISLCLWTIRNNTGA